MATRWEIQEVRHPLMLAGEEAVLIGPGLAVPRSVEVTCGAESRPSVELVLTVVDGRYVVSSVTMTATDGVTADDLRNVPLQQITREATAGTAQYETETEPGHFRNAPMIDEHHLAKLDLDVLERVALIYRYAYAVGQRPALTVAKALKMPQSTADKRIMAARAAGLLPA